MVELLTDNQDNPMNRNPNGKGGFRDHPENIGNGRWVKEASFSYWMNKFKSMSITDFENVRQEYLDNEPDKWTVAAESAYNRVAAGLKELQNFEAVADRTEGKAPQTVVIEGGLFNSQKIELEVVNADQDQSEAGIDASPTEQPASS